MSIPLMAQGKKNFQKLSFPLRFTITRLHTVGKSVRLSQILIIVQQRRQSDVLILIII